METSESRLLFLYVPPEEDLERSNDATVDNEQKGCKGTNSTTRLDLSQKTAIVAIGSLSDAHDAVLAYHSAQHRNATGTGDAKNSCPNKLRPSKEFYDRIRELGRPPTREELTPTDFHVHLYRVLAGNWLACRLLNQRGKLCGSVLFHERITNKFEAKVPQKISTRKSGTEEEENTDQKTLDDDEIHCLNKLAIYLRETICLQGGAGAYNINEEPETFLRLGGRIIGRMTWDCGGEGLRSKALPSVHPRKFCYEKVMEGIERGGYGPDFFFSPVSTYWQETWPDLKRMGYGFRPENDLGDDSGGNDNDDDDDQDDEDYEEEEEIDEPYLRLIGDSFYSFFLRQEYLAGRIILSTEYPESDPVVECIVLFTYESPEQLGDATVEGIPISGEAHSILEPSDFLWYATQETTTVMDLRRLLVLLSEQKIADLLQAGVENEDASGLSSLRNVLAAIYSTEAASQNTQISQKLSTKVRAPSLVRVHNGIVRYCKPLVVDTVVLFFHEQNKLSDMIYEVSEYYRNNPDWATPSGVLLERCASRSCAQYLIDAGAQITHQLIKDREATVGRKDETVELLLSKLSDSHDNEKGSTSPASKKTRK